MGHVDPLRTGDKESLSCELHPTKPPSVRVLVLCQALSWIPLL